MDNIIQYHPSFIRYSHNYHLDKSVKDFGNAFNSVVNEGYYKKRTLIFCKKCI